MKTSDAHSSSKDKVFLVKAWSGHIQLWQAIVFVNILGFLLAQALSIAGGVVLFELTQAKIFNILYMLFVNIVYGVFAVVCLWRSSPNPKVSKKGAITKLWILIFATYLVRLNYNFIFG